MTQLIFISSASVIVELVFSYLPAVDV